MFQEALPFIKDFISELNSQLINSYGENSKLSRLQTSAIGFCLMGILVTNSICWAKFYRSSFGMYQVGALSWMFHQSKIVWDKLLLAGLAIVFKKYNITNGVLVVDDSNKARSKSTSKIHNVHKMFDKKTSGYFKGQNLVFLLLVTDKVTIPIGFRFYLPDPKITAWEKADKKLREDQVPKKLRPQRPKNDDKYPSKTQLCLNLISEFKNNFPEINIKAILADAFYGSKLFIDKARSFYPQAQVISQIKKTHLVLHLGRKISVEEYFRRSGSTQQHLCARGMTAMSVTMNGARLIVDSHSVKRYVVALKYEGEENYRYLIASDLCWRMKDIAETYTLRWLIEVFFQDWKSNEGWRELKLQYVEGSERAVILSLLLDYSLLLHPAQIRLFELNRPICTVGSLIRQCRVDAFLHFVRNILEMPEPEKHLQGINLAVKEIYQLTPSDKHMRGRSLGRMEATPCLRYKADKIMVPA